uniref:ATP-binding cassette domain-containing protein n=1 Tax=Rhodothermus marinus TaxID=29549 RepID=UPI000B23DED3
MKWAIEIEDLTVAYQQPVLWDVDAVIPAGQMTAIVGPNGAGKSTLLKAVLGIVRPAAG